MSWLIPPKPHPPPFVFSLLSVIFLHLHYTLQPPSPLFPIPFSLCYYPPFSCYPVSSSPVTIPCSFVTLSPHPLLLPSVPLLLCLLFPCYYPLVPLLPCLLTLCYYPLFSCYPVSSYPVPPLFIPCYSPLFLCYSVSLYPVPPPCRVKNVYLSYPQGPLLCPRQGLSSMQNMPFLPLEDALLACRTCPSWRHVFKSLIVRSLR